MLLTEDIKERITHEFDELGLIEFLGLDIYDLVDILEDDIIDNLDDFLEEFAEDDT